MASTSDPVGSGLVASLAQPGGNVTGVSNLGTELGGKRLEIVREAVPKVTRVAVLRNAGNPAHQNMFKEIELAARSLGLRLQALEIRSANDFEDAFLAATKERSGALTVIEDPLWSINRRVIVELAAKNRLPAMYPEQDFVQAGGLMSYAPSAADLYRRAATYVDKILKGAKPADIPVEQPMKFELVINLKTAKALGLTIPQSVLIRADQVIQ